MGKLKINYKELFKTIIVTFMVLGYLLFVPLYSALTILFPLQWCVITNAICLICFLIQFPIFIYAIFCIYKNKIKRSIALILLFILVCATPTIVFKGEKAIYSKFTSNKWQKRVTARFLMVDDMLEKNKLIGKDKKEILELLGKQTPYEDVSVSVPKDSYKNYLVYYLGKSIDGVMHSETDYLVIYFKNSNAVEHKILTATYDF